MDMARRNFLHGRLGAQIAPMRPPWALAEKEFMDRCTRCGDCIASCPTGLLSAPGNTFPIADFANAYCNFCGHCVDACQPAALTRHTTPPWHLRAHIDEPCLTEQNVVCRSCGEICDVGAIRFPPRLGGVSRPELSADVCTGCGECLPTCPTRAISIGHSTPVYEEHT